jgi:hypothetical protein
LAQNVAIRHAQAKGFERQGQAAKIFEEVYASQPDHPGVLHYLIHAMTIQSTHNWV